MTEFVRAMRDQGLPGVLCLAWMLLIVLWLLFIAELDISCHLGHTPWPLDGC